MSATDYLDQGWVAAKRIAAELGTELDEATAKHISVAIGRELIQRGHVTSAASLRRSIAAAVESATRDLREQISQLRSTA